jgi:hypothetical protein
MFSTDAPDPSAGPIGGGTGQSLEAELEALTGLDLHELRARWRRHLRSRPPEHLSRSLLLRLLAYKLQARAYGDLDAETARTLDQIAREQARRLKRGEGPRKGPPVIPPVPGRRGLKEGTLLVREFGAEMHRVTVVAGGYAYQGATFTSLSEIARLITGTRWSGPRFFGLRDHLTKPNRTGEGA